MIDPKPNRDLINTQDLRPVEVEPKPYEVELAPTIDADTADVVKRLALGAASSSPSSDAVRPAPKSVGRAQPITSQSVVRPRPGVEVAAALLLSQSKARPRTGVELAIAPSISPASARPQTRVELTIAKPISFKPLAQLQAPVPAVLTRSEVQKRLSQIEMAIPVLNSKTVRRPVTLQLATPGVHHLPKPKTEIVVRTPPPSTDQDSVITSLEGWLVTPMISLSHVAVLVVSGALFGVGLSTFTLLALNQLLGLRLWG